MRTYAACKREWRVTSFLLIKEYMLLITYTRLIYEVFEIPFSKLNNDTPK